MSTEGFEEIKGVEDAFAPGLEKLAGGTVDLLRETYPGMDAKHPVAKRAAAEIVDILRRLGKTMASPGQQPSAASA